MNTPESMTPRQLLAFCEANINELKANNVTPGRDIDGRTGYVLLVDHIVFCALLRDDRIFMEMSHSLIELRREGQLPEIRTAFFYGPLSLFMLVP